MLYRKKYGVATMFGRVKIVGNGRDFVDRNLSGVNLEGLDLKGDNFERANLTGANLRGAYLRGTVLEEATLVDADLTGAILRDTWLQEADLSGANLTGIILSGRTNFRGAKYSDKTIFPKDFPAEHKRKMLLLNSSGVSKSFA